MDDEIWGGEFTVENNHRKFQSSLIDSRPGVLRVGRWQEYQGITVYIPPMEVAPTRAVAPEYSDDGDIHIIGPPELAGRVIEAKVRPKMKFTCACDYGEMKNGKFKKYPTVMVCNKPQFDRADPKPWKIIILNGPMTHAAIIKAYTRPDWTIWYRRLDPRTMTYQDVYMCALDLVEFERLPEDL